MLHGSMQFRWPKKSRPSGTVSDHPVNCPEQGRKQLRKSGYSGAGTTFHNTFITKAVELGVIGTVVYSMLYILPLIRICNPTDSVYRQQLIRSVVLVAITASIFRDYNIGGVRSTSILVAIFLGLANLWPLAARFEEASRVFHDPALPKETDPASLRLFDTPGQPS